MEHYTVMYNTKTEKWEMKNSRGIIVATFDTSIIPVTETIKFTVPKDTKVTFNLSIVEYKSNNDNSLVV